MLFVSITILSIGGWYSLVWMGHHFLIHSPTCRQLVCFMPQVVMNKANTNIHIKSLCGHTFSFLLGKYLEVSDKSRFDITKWPHYLSILALAFCILTITLINRQEQWRQQWQSYWGTTHVMGTALNKTLYRFLRVQEHRHYKVLLIGMYIISSLLKVNTEHASKDLNTCMYFDPWKKSMEIWEHVEFKEF